MPVPVFEGDELGAADAGDWFAAGKAALGEEFPKAFCAVWLVITAGESGTSQAGLAVCAGEALSVPWLILVGYATTGDCLVTFDTASSVFFFVTLGTIDFLLPWNEALCSNGCLAHHATEAFLVPLPSLVFHLLGSSPEDLSTTIAA